MRVIRAFSWLCVSLLFLASVTFAAESDIAGLLNLLIEKGAVTKEDAAGFRADLAIKKQEEADLAAKKQEEKEKKKTSEVN